MAPAGPSTSTWCFSELRHFTSICNTSLLLLYLFFFLSSTISQILPSFHSVEHVQRLGGDTVLYRASQGGHMGSMVVNSNSLSSFFLYLEYKRIWRDDDENLSLDKRFLLLINPRNWTSRPNQSVGVFRLTTPLKSWSQK